MLRTMHGMLHANKSQYAQLQKGMIYIATSSLTQAVSLRVHPEWTSLQSNAWKQSTPHATLCVFSCAATTSSDW